VNSESKNAIIPMTTLLVLTYMEANKNAKANGDTQPSIFAKVNINKTKSDSALKAIALTILSFAGSVTIIP